MNDFELLKRRCQLVISGLPGLILGGGDSECLYFRVPVFACSLSRVLGRPGPFKTGPFKKWVELRSLVRVQFACGHQVFGQLCFQLCLRWATLLSTLFAVSDFAFNFQLSVQLFEPN